nr:hypothetical protein Iba_chr07dCG9950 [Ipomoea batatas]
MEELQNNWNTYRRQRGSAGRRPKAEGRQSAVDSAEGRRWAVACGRSRQGRGEADMRCLVFGLWIRKIFTRVSISINLVFSDLHCCRPTTYALRVYALSPHGLTALTSSDSLTPSAHHANASTFPLRRR